MQVDVAPGPEDGGRAATGWTLRALKMEKYGSRYKGMTSVVGGLRLDIETGWGRGGEAGTGRLRTGGKEWVEGCSRRVYC